MTRLLTNLSAGVVGAFVTVGILIGMGWIPLSPGKVSSRSLNMKASSIPIAVVDVQAVENSAKVFVSFHTMLENQHKAFHTQLLEEETRLREDYNKLRQNEPKEGQKPSEKFMKMKQVFETKQAQLERSVKAKKEQLDKQSQEAYADIHRFFKRTLSKVAVQKDVSLVLSADTLVDTAGVDITKDVISALDAERPAFVVSEAGSERRP